MHNQLITLRLEGDKKEYLAFTNNCNHIPKQAITKEFVHDFKLLWFMPENPEFKEIIYIQKCSSSTKGCKILITTAKKMHKFFPIIRT